MGCGGFGFFVASGVTLGLGRAVVADAEGLGADAVVGGAEACGVGAVVGLLALHATSTRADGSIQSAFIQPVLP
jgi:hypothetical protein